MSNNEQRISLEDILAFDISLEEIRDETIVKTKISYDEAMAKIHADYLELRQLCDEMMAEKKRTAEINHSLSWKDCGF